METLDDVTFEKAGAPHELLQTKHHKNRSANLTDASSDIWKSLRIWITALDTGKITNQTMLYLFTTENAAPGSIASNLKHVERDTEAALQKLQQTAQTSKNLDNSKAYQAYLNKSAAERKVIVERIFIIDSFPDISDLDQFLKAAVFYAISREHQNTFLEYLEGWWFRRSIDQLKNIDKGNRITSEELEAQMSDLREQFRRECLPISHDLLHYELDDETAVSHSDFPFVQQIKLATDHTKRIASAIQDYYRAFEQRSRWQRQDLLFVGDLKVYEKRLVEEWELLFSAIEDRLDEHATEEEKKAAAKEVLFWAETGTVHARIKPEVSEPFITRGSLHILSNDMRIGWHPEFRTRLQYLMEGSGT
ncbi:ABC-three component system protein [Prosthecochloris sp.]|uniref:ABC-three component system protein n=1 Tax=Prosthecochloris sp. TaxID=290513 RepID=UPI0025801A4B|nr:ABC-three component system protein [Prosthecochloris sp.]